MSTNNVQLLVIKKSSLNEAQGFVTPIMQITPDGDYAPLDSEIYPGDIFISKGYGNIDKQYEQGEIFTLKSHFRDETKSHEVGAPRYWADDGMVSQLAANTLLPVILTDLPAKESGALERGIEPPAGAFFILDGSYLYGPLKSSYSDDDDQYVVEPNVNPLLSYGRGNLGRWNVNDVQSCFVKIEVTHEQRMYVKSFKHLSIFRGKNGKSADFIDYLSDDQLIKVANQTHFGKKGLSKKEAEKLQQIITNYEKENKNLQDERLDRLKAMLDKYLSQGTNGNALIKDYLEAPAGQQFLKEYVKQNEARLLQSVLDEFENNAAEKKQVLNDELDRLNVQQVKYKEEISKLQDKVTLKRKETQDEIERIAKEQEDEIERIAQETEEQRQKKLEENQAELSAKIAEKEAELEVRNVELVDLCEKLNVANEIKELKAESAYYERDVDKQKEKAKKEVAQADQTIKAYLETIKEDDKFNQRVGEMYAIERLFKGGSSDSAESQIQVAKQLPMSSVQPESATDLIDYLCSQFSDNGRGFTFDEMTNLVVCLQQSFLTVLAGGPGTGKTSTVTRLAKAMNLGSGQFGEHFLNIPVGRGWVSSRDILGFYNSLKDTYQESRSGLFSFLSHHQEHPSDAAKIILLDEANLSSIEHYWSDFLVYCDKENLSRPIDTGIPNANQKLLNIDEMTRFVATINFDSTTEPLSPRLIDRVPVITLDTPDSSVDFEPSSLSLDGMLSGSKIKSMFTFEDNALLRSEHILLQDTVELLGQADRSMGPAINISQRKLNAISNYVSASRELIGSDTAMDFAISQFILPHIDGYGSAFKTRLESLSDKVSKHSRTQSHLERILTSGDYLSGSYSFFG